jgi:hypothetical protein
MPCTNILASLQGSKYRTFYARLAYADPNSWPVFPSGAKLEKELKIVATFYMYKRCCLCYMFLGVGFQS